MNKKPTIAELEDMMDDGKYVEITPSGEVNVNPVEHVLEDVLRISELETALIRQCENMAFVLNRVDLHNWHDRFQKELEEDRKLYVPHEGGGS